jgi:prolyl 4-hydroxylase
MEIPQAAFRKTNSMNDYIKVYDGVLDDEFCKTLIDEFESIPDQWERFDNQGRPNFNQFNITEYASQNKETVWYKNHDVLVEATHKYGLAYMNELEVGHFWPDNNALEQYRMKKYNNDGVDQFATHVDVGDFNSARRFLVMFFYLNDVNEGGETYFPTLDYSVKPKTGRLVVFPPLWPWPHEGKAPVSNEKYIVGTYLHYV